MASLGPFQGQDIYTAFINNISSILEDGLLQGNISFKIGHLITNELHNFDLVWFWKCGVLTSQIS